MNVPCNIPYNPSLRGVGIFFGFAILFLGVGSLSLIPTSFAFLICGVFVMLSALLFVRRVAWRRQLIVTTDFITVPSGLLRLQPKAVACNHIAAVWVARIFFTSVICVRTGDRTVEIQDMYLPDAETFRSLKQFLDTTVQSAPKGI